MAAALLLTFPAAGTASQALPMSGSFHGSIFFAEPRCGTELLTVGFEGIGLGTHLGRMTGEATNCTEFTLASQAVPVLDGQAVFTAADGSTINATYTGWQDAPVNGIATYANTVTVQGGTGRFTEATGTWVLEGSLDLVAGSIAGSVTGWLAY